MNLAALDLNLLLVLHTVLTEGSVARAAARLHVTPSAVSNALARLRGALGDPLFTRRGRGVVPTPRALALAPPLATALATMQAALAEAPFDPATCTRTFTLAAADVVQVAWLPAITRRLAQVMPRARLRVIDLADMLALGDLGSPELDVHLGVRGRGPGMRHAPLATLRLVMAVRRDHPLARRPSRAALAALGHVAVALPPGRGPRDRIDAAYVRAGVTRAIAVTVPSFTVAAAVAAGTDLVATLPTAMVARHRGLRAIAGARPSHRVPIELCWHQRTDADPASIALRAAIDAAVRGAARAH